MEQLAIPYYGVQIAAKLLEIPTPKISYIAQSQLPNPTITAMYLQETKEILFNEDWVLQANWLEVIGTSFHECRHAYQHYCVTTNTREDEAIRDQWSTELASYFQPDTDKQQELDINYLYQSIEIDAIAFTTYYLNVYFSVSISIPSIIRSQVEGELKRIYKMEV